MQPACMKHIGHIETLSCPSRGVSRAQGCAAACATAPPCVYPVIPAHDHGWVLEFVNDLLQHPPSQGGSQYAVKASELLPTAPLPWLLLLSLSPGAYLNDFVERRPRRAAEAEAKERIHHHICLLRQQSPRLQLRPAHQRDVQGAAGARWTDGDAGG